MLARLNPHFKHAIKPATGFHAFFIHNPLSPSFTEEYFDEFSLTGAICPESEL